MQILQPTDSFWFWVTAKSKKVTLKMSEGEKKGIINSHGYVILKIQA